MPPLDRKAQWPEGLRVYRETSIGMEYLYGLIFRLIPGGKAGLPSFIRFFTAFFFSLSIFPLAFFAADLWRSRWGGVLAAALFAVALPLVGRSSGFEMIRENVTFTFLVYHIYFFLSARSGAGWSAPILSAVFLSLGLSTWQGTQFYLVPLLAFLLVMRLIGGVTPGERRAVRTMIAFIVVSGGAVPFLREGGFLLSIPVGFSAAWLAADMVLERKRGSARDESAGIHSVAGMRILGLAVAFAAFACILLPGVLLKGHFVSYSHFFKLILYKLRYVHKPADPTLLPFDARAFWVGPFHSPDARHIFVFALPIILLLPNQAARLAARARRGDFPSTFTLAFLAVFFVFFLLMQRLLPLFGVFAAAAAAGNAVVARRAGTGSAVLKPSIIFTLCIMGVFLLQDFAWEGPADIWRRTSRLLRIPSRKKFAVYPYSGDVEGALLAWIDRNTPGDAVILSYHYLSPQVLTYTGRSTNLNDFFESPRLRRKAERFLELLYSSEDRLLEFCREQSSDYLLISIAAGCDPTRDSPLYQAGLMDVPPDCAAYRFLFEPEKLKGFNLVYENEMYRLFRVGEAPSKRMWPRSPLFYERELLWRFEGDIEVFYNSVMHVYALSARAQRLVRMGRYLEAESALTDALRLFYFYPAWRSLDDIYRRRGRMDERKALAEYAYQYDPYRCEVCIELARSRMDLGETGGARAILEKCSRLHQTKRQRTEILGLLRRLDGMQKGGR